MNVFELIYRLATSLLRRLRVYEERTDRYLSVFEEYIYATGVILDAGCGSGVFSRSLIGGGRLVIGLDIDFEALGKLGRSSVERVCADAHHLPLRDCSVDFVLSLSLLEHLKYPEKCVEELYRVLKNGGRVVIQIPNLQYVFEPHTKWPLLYLLPKAFQSQVFSRLGYSYVNMNVTFKFVLWIIQKTGFRIKKVVKVYHLHVMKPLVVPPAYMLIVEKKATTS